MRRRLAAILLPAALLAGAAPGDAAGEVAEVVSARYRVRSEGPREEAEEWARVLEAAWPQYEAFFGAAPRLAPDERLAVSFFEGPEGFRAAIRATGGSAPAGGDVGGYYDPVSRGVFLWRQPTRWFTRCLLLHEAAHQFHYLARTGNRAVPAPWYVEGVAEHLGHHTWDGTTLRLGVVPPISLEDYAGKALAAVSDPAFRLESLVGRGAGAPRPEAMHLARFLATTPGPRERWGAFAARLDRGALAGEADFARAFGPIEPLRRRFAAWLGTVQQPFLYGHVEWDARGPDAIRGTSPVVAVCRSRLPARRIRARWRRIEGAGRAGLLLGWRATDDFAAFLVRGDGGGSLDVRRDGAWVRHGAQAVAPPADGLWTVAAERDGDAVLVTLEGRVVLRWEGPRGPFGLAVDAGTVEFTDVHVESEEAPDDRPR